MGYDGPDRIESKELFVVVKKNPEAAGDGQRYGKEGFVIRVVAWIYEKKKGGIGQTVSLEKRTLFVNDEGETRSGKAKGFSLEDLAVVQDKWGEIVAAMKNPPAPAWPGEKAAAKSTAAQPTEDFEKVAF